MPKVGSASIPTYGAVLLEIEAVPNPNPTSFALNLDRTAAQVHFRIYSVARNLVMESYGGSVSSGWSQTSLPDGVSNLPNGLYYVSCSVRGTDADWCVPKVCKMVILK
jgi:hypothetical protein